MLIQIRSNNIPVNAELEATLSGFVEKSLKRFSERITRVEVHLEDENSQKSGKNDKRCSIEIRPENIEPIIVSSKSDNLIQAVRTSANKARTTLDRTIGKLRER